MVATAGSKGQKKDEATTKGGVSGRDLYYNILIAQRPEKKRGATIGKNDRFVDEENNSCLRRLPRAPGKKRLGKVRSHDQDRKVNLHRVTGKVRKINGKTKRRSAGKGDRYA